MNRRWIPNVGLGAVLGLTALGVTTLGAAGCDDDAGRGRNGESAPTEPTSSVVWPEAREVDGAALALLSQGSRRVVATSPVPALIVRTEELAKNSTVMAKPSWYAMSTRHDGVIVSVHATHVAHSYDHIAPALPDATYQVRGHNARVTQNDKIWSVAWIEAGAAYSLELECARLPDKRCADADHLMELAEDLAFVGGAGVTPGGLK